MNNNRPYWPQLRKRLFVPLLAAVGVATACYLFGALYQQGQLLAIQSLQLSWSWLTLAVVMTLAYRLLNACGWSLVLGSLGAEVCTKSTAMVWLKSEACRWLPGSIWNWGSRAAMAGKFGVCKKTASVSVLLELMLSVAAWLSLAVSAALLWAPVWVNRLPAATVHSVSLVTATAILLLTAVVWVVRRSTKFRTCATQAWQRLKQLAGLHAHSEKLLIAGGAYLGLCLLNGIAFWMILRSCGPTNEVPLAVAAGANAAAWLVGFFALFAPGGLVVREACLVLLLSPWLPPAVAIQAAVLWRMVQMSVEAVVLACVVLPSSTALLSRLKWKRPGLLRTSQALEVA